MTMTPRSRWLALLAGRSADRIPTDYQATAEVTSRLLADLVRHLGQLAQLAGRTLYLALAQRRSRRLDDLDRADLQRPGVGRVEADANDLSLGSPKGLNDGGRPIRPAGDRLHDALLLREAASRRSQTR